MADTSHTDVIHGSDHVETEADVAGSPGKAAAKASEAAGLGEGWLHRVILQLAHRKGRETAGKTECGALVVDDESSTKLGILIV